MAAVDGVRFADVDATLADAFLAYAHGRGDLDHAGGFNPAREPAVLALDELGVPVGAASVVLDGHAANGYARFGVLDAADPALYAPLIDAVLERVPVGIARVCHEVPDRSTIGEALASAGFAQSRRAYVMLHPSPSGVTEPELPAETVLVSALATSASDWANVVNAAFRGHPGHEVLTSESAATALARPGVIRAGTLIAYRGGTPAGVVMTVADEANPYGAEIEVLAVLPADQHIGLGRALLRAALGAAGRDGRSSVILSVGTFSKRAMAMYLDAGFGVHDVRVCWELARE